MHLLFWHLLRNFDESENEMKHHKKKQQLGQTWLVPLSSFELPFFPASSAKMLPQMQFVT